MRFYLNWLLSIFRYLARVMLMHRGSGDSSITFSADLTSRIVSIPIPEPFSLEIPADIGCFAAVSCLLLSSLGKYP